MIYGGSNYCVFERVSQLLQRSRFCIELRRVLDKYLLIVFHVARYACNALRVLQSSVAVRELTALSASSQTGTRSLQKRSESRRYLRKKIASAKR